MSARSTTAGRKPRVTVRDVARDLGMSVATVSRAFHAEGTIALETRRQVLKRAGELGYRPNPFARSLITKRTHIAGIVAADITNPFYPEVLTRLTESLQAIDMNVMLFTANPSRGVDESLRLMLHYQPDIAILLAASLSSEAAQACREAGTPVIFFNRYAADRKSFAVTCDNTRGGRELADHLIDRGYRRLAYVAGRPDASTNVDRWKGFRARCLARGLPEPLREEAGSFSYEAGYAAACRLLARDPRPDAVFGANDILAIGVIDAARREFGLALPEDLAVVGFDDIAMAAWPPYFLTTMRQPIERMIASTIELVGRLTQRSEEAPSVTRIPGKLIERGTTRQASESEPEPPRLYPPRPPKGGEGRGEGVPATSKEGAGKESEHPILFPPRPRNGGEGRGEGVPATSKRPAGKTRIPSKPLERARELRQRSTDSERRLWHWLRNRQIDGVKFRRQVPLGAYVVDFLAADHRLVIEIDGGQHASQQDYDRRRTAWLEAQGYRVIRFWSNEVLANTEGVIAAIGAALKLRPPHPDPLTPAGGEGE